MCVWGGGGGLRVNETLEKNIGCRIMRFQNKYWVCKFVEMGWDMFLRKNREIIVLRRINLWGGGGGWGVATLLKMGLTGILVRYFVKTENCIWLQK